MRKLLLAGALLSISCVERLCGCSPEQFGVVVRGTLQNASGDPLPGKRVRAETAAGDCSVYYSDVSAVSKPDGAVSITVLHGVIDSLCVRLFARDTLVGATESPVGSVLRVRTDRFPWDTLDVSLTVAPTVR